MPVFAQQLIDEKNAEIDHLNKHILQLQTAGDSRPDTPDAANIVVSSVTVLSLFHLFCHLVTILFPKKLAKQHSTVLLPSNV